MDLICRICRQSEVDELISISCMAATQLKRISDMINAVTGLSVEEFDRLPQDVCRKCFERLDRTYRLWKLCRRLVSKEVLSKKKQNDHRCRICCALIEGEACKKWDKVIGGTVQHLSGVFIVFNDNSHSWFVCNNCLFEMDAAYDFKSKCIASEASLQENMSFTWERMEVDAFNPEHLVIDLYAEAVQEQDCRGSVHCSVCLLEVEIQQLGKKCEGCMLQFRNYDGIRSVQSTLCAEENIRSSPGEIESISVEQNLSQELIDDQRDDECLIEFEMISDTNTEPDDDNHTELTESSNKGLAYIVNSQTRYEIFEKYPDDPFPKARRVGPCCCKCMKFFDTRFELQAHTKQRHQKPSGIGEFSCDVCLSLFVDQQSLELHKAKLQTIFYDFCKSCQLVLTSPYILMQHKKTIHPEFVTVGNKQSTNKSVSVDTNSTRATEENDANDHRMVETSSIKSTANQPTEGSFPIKVQANFKTEIVVTYNCCLRSCYTRYSSEEQLLKHLKTAHYLPKQLQGNVCQYCGMKFPNETALQKHCNRRFEWKLYKCLIDGCGFTRTAKSSLIEHCSQNHHKRSTNEQKQKPKRQSRPLNESTHKSAFVDKNSSTAAEGTGAIVHRMAETSLIKPIEGSSLAEVETNFETEIVVTYDCCLRDCKNRYSSEEQLTKHMNTAHYQSGTQILKNVCQYCKKKFPKKTALLKHSNRMVERKVHRCLFDGCSFTRTLKSSIIYHCSQKPHISFTSAYDPNSPAAVKSRPLDLKHFSVVGKMDDNTDIVERKSELCCRCFVLFDSKEGLAAHCEQHSTKGRRPFHCQVCGRGFLTQSTYTSHRNLTKNPIHYFCRICEKILWAKSEYTMHRAVHFPGEKNDEFETMVDPYFTCCGCRQPFRTDAELVEHRRENHPPPSTSSSIPLLKCDQCHMFFNIVKELEKHIALYENNVTYKCKLPSCAFTTKIIERMRFHILGSKHQDAIKTVQHNVDPSEYFCCTRGCEFQCRDYDTMIEHGRAAHAQRREYFSTANKMNRKFKCLVCGRGFVKEITMINHKNKKHIERFHCQGCKLYVPRTERSSHVRCVEKLILKCEICDKMMISKAELQQHAKLVHSHDSNKSKKPEKFVCNKCGKQVNDLVTHMESHENERTWVCKICDARFNQILLLRNHQRVHSNERSYACRHGCEKRYKAPGDRNRHEKLVHLGITPFRCDLCEASFIRLRDLRLHQRKHTGLKLFSCSHCFADFNKKSEYDDHCKQCRKSDL